MRLFMRQISSWLQNRVLRSIWMIFLVGVTFLVNPELNKIDFLQTVSSNTVKTPEGIYYQGTPDWEQVQREESEEGSIGKKIQETAETIKEKLNLNEPLPKSTKDFFQLQKTGDEQ